MASGISKTRVDLQADTSAVIMNNPAVLIRGDVMAQRLLDLAESAIVKKDFTATFTAIGANAIDTPVIIPIGENEVLGRIGSGNLQGVPFASIGGGGATIYTADDSLSGNRVVDLNAHTLTFSYSTDPVFTIDPTAHLISFFAGNGVKIQTGLTLGQNGSYVGNVAFQGLASGAVIIRGANAITDYTLTLPDAVGGAGTVLTDVAGDGILSWVAGGGGAFPDTEIVFGTGTGSTSSANLTWNDTTRTLIVNSVNAAIGDSGSVFMTVEKPTNQFIFYLTDETLGTGSNAALSINSGQIFISAGVDNTVSSATTLQFQDGAATNYFGIRAADTIGTTRTMIFPNDDPTAGEFLKVTSYASNIITTEWAAAGGSGAFPAGTIGQTLYYAVAGTAVTATSNLYNDGTNIGIGIVPVQPLHVANTANTPVIRIENTDDIISFDIYPFKNNPDGSITGQIGSFGLRNNGSAYINNDGATRWYELVQMDATTPSTNNRLAMWTAGNRIGDSAWFISGNDIAPLTDGANIGVTGTNRIGTIFMASTLDVAASLTIAVAGTPKYTATATVFSPAANDGAALGSTSLMWSDLFLASGAVINISNGDFVATHATGELTVGTGTLKVATQSPGNNTTAVATTAFVTAAVAAGAGGITIGTTAIASGTGTRLLYETSGNKVGEISGATSDGTSVTFGSANLLATSPKITTQISDANGNAMITFSATASAVDTFTIVNAATANPATISFKATGSDSNINTLFSPKGTGRFQISDGTDLTKILAFNLSGATTGITGTFLWSPSTAKTITFPNVTDTVAVIGTNNTFSASQGVTGNISASTQIRACPGNAQTTTIVYRTTNAGGDVTPGLYEGSNAITAGVLGYAFDVTNGFSLVHGNGTRMIASAAIALTNLVNTLASEAGDLGFYTQLAGAAMALRVTIGGSAMTFIDAYDHVFGSTTGTKLGTATSQKIGFWNATPIIQPASANQAAVATTAATNVTPYGYTQAQADGIITLLNQIRSDLVAVGIMKGSA